MVSGGILFNIPLVRVDRHHRTIIKKTQKNPLAGKSVDRFYDIQLPTMS